MSVQVYGAIVEHLKEGKKGCIATIVRRIGSSPREEGTSMFVSEDGKIFGTIGGGSLEKEVRERALEILEKEEPLIFEYRMDAKSVEEEGMLCGGNVDVLVEPVLPRHLTLYEEAKEWILRRKGGVFFVRFGRWGYFKTLFGRDGETYGDDIDEKEKVLLLSNLGIKKPLFLDDEKALIPLNTRSTLYIFGAGHVSRYLATLANLVDFSVTVIDDSEDFARKENFPDAEAVFAVPFEESFNFLNFTGEEYVVIVTRGHKSDALCLEEVLKRPFRYVGMIGSKRKVKAVFEYLKNKGYEESLLNKVHAPIGIEINSETPQEVAISIVAELIKERGEYLKNVR
jgi:xanthine dehydrogenase accessory factor